MSKNVLPISYIIVMLSIAACQCYPASAYWEPWYPSFVVEDSGSVTTNLDLIPSVRGIRNSDISQLTNDGPSQYIDCVRRKRCPWCIAVGVVQGISFA